jgi:hypothetical protein
MPADRLIFERNLLALAPVDPPLGALLSGAETTRGRYRFLAAKNGESVPAVVDSSGAAKPLHSLVDPVKEAERLADTLRGPNFVVLLGLGGGYLAEAVLRRDEVQGVVAIDFDRDGIAELFAARSYQGLFADPRFRLLVDPDEAAIRRTLLSAYRPAFSGGIAVLPLRARSAADPGAFEGAADQVKALLEEISDDYSVQAYFGKRWFANVIRNLGKAQASQPPLPPLRRVAVTAAGPSLEDGLEDLRRRRSQQFILATDTSLPALLSAGIRPDAVISIDCQHISYFHFMEGLPEGIPLFLDLASPPIVAGRSAQTRFFSGGHPLTQYVSTHWRSFPKIDTSGGNVTYAAVALADALGAERIELYGADFSYPGGAAYARGTYIHPYFQRRQNRLTPLEAHFAGFLFRNATLDLVRAEAGFRYETKPLTGYRQKLERLAPTLSAVVVARPGRGIPLSFPAGPRSARGYLPVFATGRPNRTAEAFLADYAAAIRALPAMPASSVRYAGNLTDIERDVLTTLLPTAAALRKAQPQANATELFESLRAYCLGELDRVQATAP